MTLMDIIRGPNIQTTCNCNNTEMYFFLYIALLVAASNGQEEPKIEDRIDICKTPNGFYKDDRSCDAYVECRDYRLSRMICPDGLNYNPKAVWPNYPCSYPADVPCTGRIVSQPPNPTPECPRQYGFFPSPMAAANDCGQYRLCAEGRAYDMNCPFGLAFDMARARCDWPERVPGCNAQEFLGFTCPAPEYDENGNPLVVNYKYEGDCYLFFSCQSGHAHLLSCDEGLAFDPILGKCVDSERVNCIIIHDSVEDNKDKAEA